MKHHILDHSKRRILDDSWTQPMWYIHQLCAYQRSMKLLPLTANTQMLKMDMCVQSCFSFVHTVMLLQNDAVQNQNNHEYCEHLISGRSPLSAIGQEVIFLPAAIGRHILHVQMTTLVPLPITLLYTSTFILL